VVDKTLDSTAAQVLPVLWVILVFQLGFYSPSKKGYLSLEADERHHRIPAVLAWFFALLGLLMLFGETFSILALTTDKPASGFTEGVVKAALLLGTWQVFFFPTQPWFETALDRTPLGRAKYRAWQRAGWKGKDPFLDEDVEPKEKKGKKGKKN
jgi:hypothetical protein